jgi:formylglycine-generating enzyme required for sulfatase activity
MFRQVPAPTGAELRELLQQGDHRGAADAGGFSLHAGLAIQLHQREKRECRREHRPVYRRHRCACLVREYGAVAVDDVCVVRLTPVGSVKPNAFSLYDTSGNVWTWVEDCFADNYGATPVDGSAYKGSNCERRVVRSGSWIGSPQDLRSVRRYGVPVGFRDYGYGLRVARVL